MADRYDRSIKVRQSTIDEIKKLGMSKAIEKAKSSGDREFVEGAKRFYGGNRVSGKQPTTQMKRSIEQTRTGKPVSTTPSPEAKSSAPAAQASPVAHDAVARRLANTKEAAARHPFKQAKAEREEKKKKTQAHAGSYAAYKRDRGL